MGQIVFCCRSICPLCQICQPPVPLSSYHYKAQNKKKKAWLLDVSLLHESSAKAPLTLLIINYVYIIFFLLPALEKKLKRAIVFLIPLG